jgi:hypothetical protein
MSRVAIVSAAVAFSTCLATPVHASPSGDACPGGRSQFVLWDVSTEPYGVDNLVDERGNNDGLACAKPIYSVVDEEGNPFQIYNFLDNSFPSRG